MSIIKRFKDYFKTETEETEREVDLTFDFKKVEDKIRDIFFGSIEDCDDFDTTQRFLSPFELESNIKTNMLVLHFRYFDLLYKFKSKSDRAIEIEKEVNKSIKKLKLEYNLIDTDAPAFLYTPTGSTFKTEYRLHIWFYKQKGEK